MRRKAQGPGFWKGLRPFYIAPEPPKAGYLTSDTVSVGAFVYGVQNADVRNRLNRPGMSLAERRMAERELKGLRDRLVVNYSPLVKYAAGRVCARLSGP
jgi:hypothetical protein